MPRLSIVSITMRSLCFAKASSTLGGNGVKVGTGESKVELYEVEERIGVGNSVADGVGSVFAHAASRTSTMARISLTLRIARSFLMHVHPTTTHSIAEQE
jgi:hypothetical protein